MTETVVLDFELKSPVDRVWHALTDSATLSKWMMFKSNDFKPVVGHAFQFREAPGWDGVVDCEVTDVDEPHRLAYTWTAPGVDGTSQSTVVTFTLSEKQHGITQLHLEQSGFRTEAKQEIGGAKYAWQGMVEQLQGLLASK